MKTHKININLIAAILVKTNIAAAGSVEGPYVVWLNLGENKPSIIDDQVRNYLNSGDDLCWNSNARMYMKLRPPGLTDNLAKEALISKSKISQSIALSILNKPFDEVPGFDGAIAYIETPEPHFTSISSKGKIKHEPITEISNPEAIKASLCIVMPAISRKP